MTMRDVHATELTHKTRFGPPIPAMAAARKLSASVIRKGYKSEALHAYTDAGGTPLFWRIRLKHSKTGDKWIRPLRLQGMVYDLAEPGFLDGKPLYRLHDLAMRHDEVVVVTEGEHKADKLAALGLLVTTSGAADSAGKADWGPLAGRDVMVWPDYDEPGQRYAQAVAAALVPLGSSVRVVDVAVLGLEVKGDAVDWLAAHPSASAQDVLSLPIEPGQTLCPEALQDHDHSKTFVDSEAIVAAAEAGDVGAPFGPAALATLGALRVQDVPAWMRLRQRLKHAEVGITELERQLQRADGESLEQDQTATDKLIALARDQCQFRHDPQREPYAVFMAGGARQVYGVLSAGFSDYLSHAYYREHDRAPTESSLKVALATLRGQAQFEGQTCDVFTRIARTAEGYWLDLCNDAWQCVQITAKGWTVVAGERAPLFTRSASMRPLPVPAPGGRLDALWPLVNIPEADRPMVLTWLLECLRPDTPHVVLELVGEQGSAKSSTQRVLRRLIDPNQADLRAAPKSVDDVWIAARNSHMVSLENLSHLSPAYQDALCVLATGGGYAARTLYTNADETIIELCKPIVLNGISVIVTAQDLLDRCLHIDLPTIQCRQLAGSIEERFEAVQPALLGAILDLFVKVLAALPKVKIAPERLPRMADFAALGEAVYTVQGAPAGAFLTRYDGVRKDGVLRTIDASPVGAALTAYLSDVPSGFNGTLTELLDRLDRHRPHGEAWPRSAKGLGDALRRLAPALRMIGIECKCLPKTGGVIRWHIFSKPRSAEPSPASPASPDRPATAHPKPLRPSRGAGHAGHSGHGTRSQSPGKSVTSSHDGGQDDDGECF